MPVTDSQIEIEWQGEKLHLLARKGILWPREKTLFVADPHFGKAATFRKEFRFQSIPLKMIVGDYYKC